MLGFSLVFPDGKKHNPLIPDNFFRKIWEYLYIRPKIQNILANIFQKSDSHPIRAALGIRPPKRPDAAKRARFFCCRQPSRAGRHAFLGQGARIAAFLGSHRARCRHRIPHLAEVPKAAIACDPRIRHCAHAILIAGAWHPRVPRGIWSCAKGIAKSVIMPK